MDGGDTFDFLGSFTSPALRNCVGGFSRSAFLAADDFGIKSWNSRILQGMWLRKLMELGISPIVTSGMIIQILAGSELIDLNLDLKSDREL
jgi:hypothetical protein